MNYEEEDRITEEKRKHLRPLRMFNTFGMILRNGILVETKLVLKAEFMARRVDYDWSPVNEDLAITNWNLKKNDSLIIAYSSKHFDN